MVVCRTWYSSPVCWRAGSAEAWHLDWSSPDRLSSRRVHGWIERFIGILNLKQCEHFPDRMCQWQLSNPSLDHVWCPNTAVLSRSGQYKPCEWWLAKKMQNSQSKRMVSIFLLEGAIFGRQTCLSQHEGCLSIMSSEAKDAHPKPAQWQMSVASVHCKSLQSVEFGWIGTSEMEGNFNGKLSCCPSASTWSPVDVFTTKYPSGMLCGFLSGRISTSLSVGPGAIFGLTSRVFGYSFVGAVKPRSKGCSSQICTQHQRSSGPVASVWFKGLPDA